MDGYRPRTHRSQAPHLHVVDPDAIDPDFDDPDSLGRPGDRDEDLLSRLDPAVGGRGALWSLDAEPIPDEPFDWSAVVTGDRALVSTLLELSDEGCEALLDTEFRTIARRVLARIARNDPRALRRATNAARTAAALVWLAGQASSEFGRHRRRRSGALWEWFGVGSSVDRGRSLMRALGPLPEPSWFWAWGDPQPLGDADLLHSSYRAGLIRQRDALARIDEGRKPWTVSPDERTARVRTELVRPVMAAKGLLDGTSRALVTIGLGRHIDDANYYAMSIPSVHDLIVMLQRALEEAPPDAPT